MAFKPGDQDAEKLSSGKIAALVVAEPGASAVNGGTKVYNVSEPARDVFLDFFHGTDAASETLTVSDPNVKPPLEIREMSPDSRTIVIMNDDGAARDYSYVVYFSRSGLVADYYPVLTVAAGAKSAVEFVPLPFATYGYDQFIHLELTPTAGQAADQLGFTTYITGKGG